MADDLRPIPQRAPIVGSYDAGEYYWCACGRSRNQPFCDGSHKTSPYLPMRVKLDAERKVAWCACKRTGTPPYCDGTHKKLPDSGPPPPTRLTSIPLKD